jgi:hypothetical protein
MIATNGPVVWAIEHLSAIGWPAICVIAWKVASAFQGFVDKLEKMTAQVESMTTNHVPHIETSLAHQDAALDTMRDSLKEIAINTRR